MIIIVDVEIGCCFFEFEVGFLLFEIECFEDIDEV